MTEHSTNPLPEFSIDEDPSKELFKDSDDWVRLWVLRASTALEDERILSPTSHSQINTIRSDMKEQGASEEDIKLAIGGVISKDSYVIAKNELIGLLFEECDEVNDGGSSHFNSLLVGVSERAVTKEEELIKAGVAPNVREELVQGRIRDDFSGMYGIYIAGRSSRTTPERP